MTQSERPREISASTSKTTWPESFNDGAVAETPDIWFTNPDIEPADRLASSTAIGTMLPSGSTSKIPWISPAGPTGVVVATPGKTISPRLLNWKPPPCASPGESRLQQAAFYARKGHPGADHFDQRAAGIGSPDAGVVRTVDSAAVGEGSRERQRAIARERGIRKIAEQGAGARRFLNR